MFHVILDPLLLWIGTDALGQFGSEAVEEGVLAQLDEILEGFPPRDPVLLPGGSKGVERRGLWR